MALDLFPGQKLAHFLDKDTDRDEDHASSGAVLEYASTMGVKAARKRRRRAMVVVVVRPSSAANCSIRAGSAVAKPVRLHHQRFRIRKHMQPL